MAARYVDNTASPLSKIQSYINSGYHAGAWDGPGLTSSAAATSHGAVALGYVDGDPTAAPTSIVAAAAAISLSGGTAGASSRPPSTAAGRWIPVNALLDGGYKRC